MTRTDSASRLIKASPQTIYRAFLDPKALVRGELLELVPDERVVQRVEFESDDPAFAGAMRMTWSLAPVPGGTLVTTLCEDVPEGIRKEDHDAGLQSTLGNLAASTE